MQAWCLEKGKSHSCSTHKEGRFILDEHTDSNDDKNSHKINTKGSPNVTRLQFKVLRWKESMLQK